MTLHRPLLALGLAGLSTAVLAADMLPLRQGLYVPAGVACRGASNADIVTYWGGKSSIGAAQQTCTITSLVKRGNVYKLGNRCKDVQSGSSFDDDPTTLTIGSATAFTMAGTRFHYCGPTRQF